MDLAAYRDELTTEQWCRVLDEARELGVLQVHLSGGEPLGRRDLAALVAHSHRRGMYTSLVTSGVPLTEARFACAGRGGPGPRAAVGPGRFRRHRRCDRRCPSARAQALRCRDGLTGHRLPLTLNVVLHRDNIGHVAALAELAERMGADRLELANTQYYGWARRNWTALLPTRSQVEEAERDVQHARARLGSRMEIVYVVADYYEDRPKPCMYGWGIRQLILAPNGDALPCPAAGQIPGLGVANVRDKSLSDKIRHSSPAFNRFRGTSWMPEPCRSCPRKEVDFGGCRCQAYQLTGDPAATDPCVRAVPASRGRHRPADRRPCPSVGTEDDGGRAREPAPGESTLAGHRRRRRTATVELCLRYVREVPSARNRPYARLPGGHQSRPEVVPG